MGQFRHGSATTTHAVRAAIQRSQASLAQSVEQDPNDEPAAELLKRIEKEIALCDQLESSLTTATTTRSRLLEALLHEALGHNLEAV